MGKAGTKGVSPLIKLSAGSWEGTPRIPGLLFRAWLEKLLMGIKGRKTKP